VIRWNLGVSRCTCVHFHVHALLEVSDIVIDISC